MEKGMMWCKDDKKESMTDSLKKAFDYYSDKYGSKPDTCYVNPNAFDELNSVDYINIVSAKSILRNNFWIGNEEILPLDKK